MEDCVQIVLIEAYQPVLLAALEREDLELFPIPAGEDQLPTYGIRPKNLAEKLARR